MKRRTTNFITYDNDKDNIGSYTDYTFHVGDRSLLLTRREFEELRELMDEVMNDG